MKLYKSFKEIERSGLCHRNSVRSFIEKGHIIEVFDSKRHILVGYALLREVATEIMQKFDKLS